VPLLLSSEITLAAARPGAAGRVVGASTGGGNGSAEPTVPSNRMSSTADTPEPALIPLLPAAGLLGILGATGGNFDASTGILIVTAHDCTGAPAAGVSYALDGGELRAPPLYMDGGVLSSARDATDSSGIGGFVGVPRGYTNIEAHVGSGERVGGVGVQIAPGSITNITLVPSP